MIGSDRLDSPVHTQDSYGRLNAWCRRNGYALGLKQLPHGQMELRVSRGKKSAKVKARAAFVAGSDNAAAGSLLRKVKAAA